MFFFEIFFKYRKLRLFVFIFFQYFLDLEPFRYIFLSEHHKKLSWLQNYKPKKRGLLLIKEKR